MNPFDQIPIPLLEWYRENARELPWRSEVTPYRIWVSEVMLQQTRVAAVLGYFERFMQSFPAISYLAAAPEDKLLKLWQGLGYYSRARNLQRAAREIMERFAGHFPEDYSDIRSLSGVGDYTAAAIASIAFSLPYPAVDGNLLRVCARVSGDHGDITSPAMKRKLTQALAEIIPLDAPGSFNQAMMDLGATVCLPNGAPLCALCPLRGLCTAQKDDLLDVLPVRSRKKPRRIEERAVFLLFHEGRVALRERPSKGLLAGLWEYPCVLQSEADSLLAALHLPALPEAIGTARHIFTHIEWHMQAYCFHLSAPDLPSAWLWADQRELRERFAIPHAFSAFAPIVETELSAMQNLPAQGNVFF